MAEPDLGGIGTGGFAGSEGTSGSSVFRAASKVEINYKDVTGLVKEMTNLYEAIKKVKGALDSLDEGKTKEALKNLSSNLNGGGGVGSGGSGAVRNNGGNTTFAAWAGIGLTGAAALSGWYAGRKQSDLMSDVTSMRVSLASGQSSFGLSQANAMVRNSLGPTSFGRDDMNQAAQSIFGRYGTVGSTGNRAALSTAAAYARITMQGSAFGADLMNSASDPVVLNRLRRFTGVTLGQSLPATQMSSLLVKAAFGSSNPTQDQLDNFRPGMPQYSNMMMLTNGNAALGTAAVDEQRMKDRYYANGGKGAWNDKTVINMSDDMQKKIFGAKSLFVSQQKFTAGKAISQEAGLDLARSNLVSSNEFLVTIQQNTKEISQKLTQYLAPFGNILGGLSSKLGALGQILTPIALMSRGGGIPGMAQTLGLATAEGSATAGGVGMIRAARLGASALAGHFAGEAVDKIIGKPKDKRGMDWGNVVNYGVTGLVASGFDPLGGLAGLGAGLAREDAQQWGVGDAVDSGDQSRGADGGSKMSLTDATKLLRSRNRGGAAAVNNMAPDLRLKLGKLFAMNPALSLSSGWRSRADQQKLYALYKAGKGNLAAKPGTSNHEFGLAADIGPKSQYGWLASNARSIGLVRPMSGEPWHWEPANAKSRRGTAAAADGGEPSGGDYGAIARMISASVHRAAYGGAEQWVGSDAAPTLSGISLRALAGGGAAVAGSDAGGASTAWDTRPGSLSINATAKLAASAGIPTKQIPTAVAIAMAESGLNPRDHNTRGKDDSYGLWQINMTNAAGGPDRRKRYHLSADSQLLNPSKNAEAMAGESGHGTNWRPWTTYKYNTYQKHLAAVTDALSSGIGDPVAQTATPVTFGAQAGSIRMGGTRGGAVINLQVKEASYAEAVRMARIIKNIIDGEESAVHAARTGG